MDLQELSDWLKSQMKEKGIPGNARIDWIDIGECDPKYLDIAYNSENNTVIITQI